ncbi:DUF6054 family protein [Pyrofollis japonicus]|uniref:DUF6054 family protein n=1 Tax=Pyrofollis japonicus TaxID=3060460 RepID=UPI00295C15F9|nr:DUF6054 family protein [Pyrofollis japonicus]
MPLAHGVKAVIHAPFHQAVEALETIDYASGIYLRVLGTEPRTAVTVGEKYFIRAGNSLAATTIVVDRGSHVEVTVVATGSRESFLDFFDLGSSKDYARMIVKELAKRLSTDYEIVAEVSRLSREKADLLS